MRQVHCRKQRLLAADEAGGHLVDGHDGGNGHAALDRFDDAIVIVDVNLVARLDQLNPRTHAFCLADLRTGADPVGLRLIAGRNSAGGVSHDGHDGDRPAAKFRPQLLLDGGEVRVQVEEEPPQPRPGTRLIGLKVVLSIFAR
jgi:hypothetical protein